MLIPDDIYSCYTVHVQTISTPATQFMFKEVMLFAIDITTIFLLLKEYLYF